MSSAHYDWSRHGQPIAGTPSLVQCPKAVKLVDETLRDGLQAASARNPPPDQKRGMLHAMASVGVDVVSIGMPAAGTRHAEDTLLLAREIADARLALLPTAAARTLPSDIEAVAKVAMGAGIPVEVYAFVGTSALRQLVEGWDLAFLLRAVQATGKACAAAGLTFCLVTEDTTRSHPGVLRAVLRAAVEEGASRFCLCDTTGFATPEGAARLIAFVSQEAVAAGAPQLKLDWHGHNDRGRALSVSLFAAAAGVERIHGTALGVGERVGNASLEMLVHNLGLLGARPAVPPERLTRYVRTMAHALGWRIPGSHPLACAGEDVERAAEG